MSTNIISIHPQWLYLWCIHSLGTKCTLPQCTLLVFLSVWDFVRPRRPSLTSLHLRKVSLSSWHVVPCSFDPLPMFTRRPRKCTMCTIMCLFVSNLFFLFVLSPCTSLVLRLWWVKAKGGVRLLRCTDVLLGSFVESVKAHTHTPSRLIVLFNRNHFIFWRMLSADQRFPWLVP